MDMSDRRGELRGAREERLFIKVKSCSTDSDLVGTTIGCATQDVSASGLQLLVTQELPVETYLELWVEVKGVPGKFLLQGLVRWTETRGEQSYLCGVELQDEEEVSDLPDWQDLFI